MIVIHDDDDDDIAMKALPSSSSSWSLLVTEMSLSYIKSLMVENLAARRSCAPWEPSDNC